MLPLERMAGHLVVNIDVFRPNAAVAQITVVVFVFYVELHQVLVLGNVPVVFAFAGVRTQQQLNGIMRATLLITRERLLM